MVQFTTGLLLYTAQTKRAQQCLGSHCCVLCCVGVGGVMVGEDEGVGFCQKKGIDRVKVV